MSVAATAQFQASSSQYTSQLDAMKRAEAPEGRYSEKEKGEMKKACDDFEAIFIKMMLDSMKKTVPERTLTEKNQGEEYFEDMLYQEYATSMSKTDTFGLSEAMYQQMVQTKNGGLYS